MGKSNDNLLSPEIHLVEWPNFQNGFAVLGSQGMFQRQKNTKIRASVLNS